MIQLIKYNALQLHISCFIFFGNEFFVHDLQCIHNSRVPFLCPNNLLVSFIQYSKKTNRNISIITHLTQTRRDDMSHTPIRVANSLKKRIRGWRIEQIIITIIFLHVESCMMLALNTEMESLKFGQPWHVKQTKSKARWLNFSVCEK